jgi:DNA (cytosine-5)-methyltransferase 1
MSEIAPGIGSNGYKVASTFSGCGGSCLGFEMAGFEIVYANEFIAAAREVYTANHAATVDVRDIRDVTARDILAATGLGEGELDVLEGSPPCSAFSAVGKREKGWGTAKKYSDGEQRVDDLFFEYIRLIKGLRPRVFVAENVAGLVKGAAYGYFTMILTEMRSLGYRVKARVLDAQWLGVPQERPRLIFVGVRDDLERDPVFPKPLQYRYTLADALELSPRGDTRANEEAGVSIAGTAIGREWPKLAPGVWHERYFNLIRPRLDKPCPTITAIAGGRGTAGVTHPTELRKFSMPELRRVCGFPDDFQLFGSYAKRWERLGRSVPPPMMRAVAQSIRDEVLIPADG